MQDYTSQCLSTEMDEADIQASAFSHGAKTSYDQLCMEHTDTHVQGCTGCVDCLSAYVNHICGVRASTPTIYIV